MSMRWKKFNNIDEYCNKDNCDESEDDKLYLNSKRLSKKMQYEKN